MDTLNTISGERGSRAALAGFVFGALFCIGWILIDQSPPFDVPAQELAEYFSNSTRRRSSQIVGLWIAPFAAIAFMWFMAAFRHRLLRASGQESTLFSTVQLVSGAIFTMAIFIAGATELATVRIVTASASGNFDLDATRGIIALGSVISQIVGLRSGAVFILVSTTRAMRAELFPRWFGIASYVMAAAALLISTTWKPIVLVIPAWVVGTSLLVLSLRRNRELPIEA